MTSNDVHGARSGDGLDGIITLCDRGREVCPEFPSHPHPVRWSISDPALEGSTNRASYAAFERTSVGLEQAMPDSIRPRVPEVSDAALQWLAARLAWERTLAALRDVDLGFLHLLPERPITRRSTDAR